MKWCPLNLTQTCSNTHTAEETFSLSAAVFFVSRSMIRHWIEAGTGRMTFSFFRIQKEKVLDPDYLRCSPSKKLNFHFKRQTDLPPARSRSLFFLLRSPPASAELFPSARTKDDYTNLSPRKSRHFISSQTKSQ